MDIFKNITNFNESVEKPVVGEAADLLSAGACCLVAGVLGIGTNMIGFTAVITNRKLHTPCFLLISAQLVLACWTAFGFFTDGAQFVAAGTSVLSKSRTRLACFMWGLPKTMTLAPSAVLTWMVGVDRFISITFPVHYKNAGRRYAVASLSGAILVAIGNTLAAALTGPKMYSVIPCYNSFLSLDIDFFIYYTCHNLIFCCGSVVMYASIVFLVKFRKAVSSTYSTPSQHQPPPPPPAAGNQLSPPPVVPVERPDSGKTVNTLSPPSEDVFLRQQLSLVPMMVVMMFLYLITGVIPEMATSLSAFVSKGRYQPRVVVYASVLKALGTSADVFVLTVKCREFRKSLRTMAYKAMRKTVVEPVNEQGKS